MKLNTSDTQTNTAYHKLKSDILACRLLPGAQLSIKELAADLGLSLGGVREALARLAAEDMAVATAQKGYSVPCVSMKELEDLTAARVLIETSCLVSSMETMDLDDETLLVASFHRMNKLNERDPGNTSKINERWQVAHGEFHEALVSGCKNTWLRRMRKTLYEQSERYRSLSVPLAKKKRNVNREHLNIFNAVMARDQEVAVDLMTMHISKTTAIILGANQLNLQTKSKRKQKA